MVSTVRFGLLYVFVVLRLERRRLLHVHVTSHPTAAWTAQQMIEALPEETGVRYVIRDREPRIGCSGLGYRAFGRDGGKRSSSSGQRP
ncbi:MAG TPA: hypothetical protein VK714_00555 [Myxococcota bacterium]|nr:hypothetical protein [Myxococcota bacterium]